MPAFDPPALAAVLAIAGVIIIVASVSSGLVERMALPSVAAFLLLGLLFGPHGLGLLDFNLTDPALGTVATLTLVLVLFTDSVSLDRLAIRRHGKLAALVLGPGTLAATALTSVAAWGLLGLRPAEAAILGAALASTDPVMMRGLLRNRDLPAGARVALGVESGLNDVVVLPIVLVAMAVLGADAVGGGVAARVTLSVFLVGPIVGVVIGYASVRLLEFMRRRFGVRRDYESLFVLGVAFTAYALAEAAHGSGFMAAFAAGLAVNFLDVELCDCFNEYGEATSEMFLLFAFVAFGASLIWTGLDVLSPAVLGFGVIALFGRTAVLALVLPRSLVDPESRRLIVSFGPRALSSLLLVLLPVFAGIEGSARLFPVTALVVLMSVVVHGGMLTVLGRRRRPARARAGPSTPPAESHRQLVRDLLFVTFEELDALRTAGAPVRLLDVRTDAAWDADGVKAAAAARVPPERPVESAAALALPKHEWLVAYCA